MAEEMPRRSSTTTSRALRSSVNWAARRTAAGRRESPGRGSVDHATGARRAQLVLSTCTVTLTSTSAWSLIGTSKSPSILIGSGSMTCRLSSTKSSPEPDRAFGDVGRRNRAEQLVGLAGARPEHEVHALQPGGPPARLQVILASPLLRPALLLLQATDVGHGCFVGEAAGQEEITGVPGLHVHDIARFPEAVHGFLEDQFHNPLLVCRKMRTRALRRHAGR